MLVLVFSLPYFVYMEGSGFFSFPSRSLHISPEGEVSIGDIRLPLKGRGVIGEEESGSILIAEKGGVRKFKVYRQVRIREIQEGVDAVVVPLSNNKMEIHFRIRANAPTRTITLPVRGGEVEMQGTTVLIRDSEGKGKHLIREIRAFQGAREVEMEIVAGKGHIELVPKNYDSRFDLIIDPVFSAVITGARNDAAYDIEVDSASGVVYIAGYTEDYTTFAPARNTAGNLGNRDLFISKLNLDLSMHHATIVIGGASFEGGYTGVYMSRKPGGNLILASYTQDATLLGLPATVIGTPEGSDVVVFEVDSNLTSVVRALVIGAAGNQGLSDVEIHPSGDILLTGTTDSIPAFSIPENVFGQSDGRDVYVISIDSNLSNLNRVSILASTGNDSPKDMEIGSDSSVYLTGHTDSSSTFANGGTIFGTGPNASFVTQLDPLLTPINSVFIGSSSSRAIAVGNSAIYITGSVLDYNLLPPSVNVFGTPSPGSYMDAFVTGISHDFSTLIATALVAGSSHDVAEDVEIAGSNIIIAGNTYSSDIGPSTERRTHGSLGRSNVFFSKLTSDLSDHITTLVIGGDANDNPYRLEIVGTQIYATGETGPYLGSVSFLSNTNIFGDTSGGLETLVLSVPTTLPVPVKEEGTFHIEILNDNIQLLLQKPSYVGFEIYSGSGRLIHRQSAGYLPRGKYDFRLSLEPGAYVLRLRVGDQITTRSMTVLE